MAQNEKIRTQTNLGYESLHRNDPGSGKEDVNYGN